MAKADGQGVISSRRQHTAKPLDWRKRMSDHIAYALLVYTGLQIFVTMSVLHGKSGSMLPYFALVVILVAAIIPACRRFEKRWNRLSDAQAADPAVRPPLPPRSGLAVGPCSGPAVRSCGHFQAAWLSRFSLIAF
jgi:hypothetical protein